MISGKLVADPLFLGLTRPSMILGVSYVFASLNILGSLMAFVITNNFIFLIIILPVLHGVAYLICLKEPLALEILIMKSSNFMQCSNKTFYNGTNSYDLY